MPGEVDRRIPADEVDPRIAVDDVERQHHAEDEVDRIIAAWTRERPDLDLAPLAVLSRVTRIARAVDGVRRGAFAGHGLETWEFDVLAALRRCGPPYTLSPGRLIAETGVTSGTMTNRLDRLVERGLIEREPDPKDRRSVAARLTDAGRVAVDDALAELVTAERELLSDLTDDERQSLADLLRRLALVLPPA